LDFILEIGVLDEDHVSAGLGQSASDGMSLSRWLVLEDQSHARMALVLERNLARAVCRMPFNDDDFDVDAIYRLAQDAVEDLSDRRRFVVHRHDNRESRPRRRA